MRRVNKELVKLSGQLLATSVLVSGNYYPQTVTVSRYLSATAHFQRLDELKKHFSAGIRLVWKCAVAEGSLLFLYKFLFLKN